MTRLPIASLAVAALLGSAVAGLGQGSDPIGLDALRSYDPTLTGTGVIVAQAEALYSGPDSFEVDPASVGQPSGNFVYTGTDGGTATGFPNSVGTDSGHADTVGDIFYGDNDTADPEGVAPGVSQVYNYEADYFVNTIVNGQFPIPARIVNQSFVALTSDNAEQEQLQQVYDDYAATYNTLFISGVGNGGDVLAPASSYNGIGVGAYGGQSSTGPTYDGRSKPDITAPASETSFATPEVAGAAAILLEAAQRGDAGPGTEADASDARTLKALLLNGAVKPAGWTNTPTAPLDPTYGAGILNVYNSYMNLRAGEYTASAATSGSVSSINSGATVRAEGWDLASISTAEVSGTYTAESNHYLFDLSAATAPAFTLTSTLTWWKQAGQTSINDLDLSLYDAATGDSISISDSTIDNIQELFVQNLAPGDYDLIVTKNGGASILSGGSVVSSSETYALAFNFAPVPEPSACWLLLPGLALLLGKLRAAKTGVP